MERSHDVHAGAILEHPKIRADARVEVEEFVLAIPLVEAIIDVHYACVGDGFQPWKIQSSA